MGAADADGERCRDSIAIPCEGREHVEQQNLKDKRVKSDSLHILQLVILDRI